MLRSTCRVPITAFTTTLGKRQVHNRDKEDLSSLVKCEVEEIRISIPYGEIAGKWWGPKDVRPIVSLHGWLDNAGTFDRLIPLLPNHMSFLTLDLPGHGLSSRMPNGMIYSTLHYAYLLEYIMHEYQWKKISLLGHSLGSVVSFIYSSIFPKKVDLFVGIDLLKPRVSDPVKLGPRLEKSIPKLLASDIRNQDAVEPPSYSYEELVERIYLGSKESVSKSVAPYLLTRNIKKSCMHPEKYYFTYDNRLKYLTVAGWGQDVNLELAKRMTMPYMFIKALHSPYFEDKKYFDEFVQVVKQNNQNFELEFVNSTHHLHLTEPEKVAPLITKFLCKHWQKEDVCGNQLKNKL